MRTCLLFINLVLVLNWKGIYVSNDVLFQSELEVNDIYTPTEDLISF